MFAFEIGLQKKLTVEVFRVFKYFVDKTNCVVKKGLFAGGRNKRSFYGELFQVAVVINIIITISHDNNKRLFMLPGAP